MVKTANWLNHLEHDWESPLWRHWMREFLNGHCLVRYDERANGLSDWDTPEISFEAFVDDLACVVDAAGLERFDLLGISQGAAVAIAYAVRHPERVRRNLDLTKGLVFSGQLLLDLAAAGMLREDAYRVVQAHAMKAWDEDGDFRAAVEADTEIARVLTRQQLAETFSLDRHVRHVDKIFQRVFGDHRS